MGRLADVVRSLAAARSGDAAHVSLYLDLDPATVPTASDLRSHVTALADQAARLAEERAGHADHAAQMRVRNDLARIRELLVDDFDRTGTQGLALFVAGDETWRELRLPGAVEDAVHIGHSFVVAPLLPFVERDRDVVLVVVGRERGTIWRAESGRVDQVEDLSRRGQGRHDQGGWSQSRFQRSLEVEAHEHMRGVADATSDLVRPGSETLLAVSCLPERRTEFEELLAPHVREALLGWAEYDVHADGDDLRPEVERMLDQHLRAERRALLDRWREERGQASGKTGLGWAEILEAAADGAVDVLLVDGTSPEAYECPSCGRGYLEPGTCELDSDRLRDATGGALELAIRSTLEHGGTVRWALDEVEGAAVALLRFPLPVAVSGRARG